MERTLSIIKPDGVSRRLIGNIISRYEQKGLKIIDMEMLLISKECAEQHYEEHKGKGFYPDLIDYITSGSSVIIELEGTNAISEVRSINSEIRKELALSTTQNTVHGSDSVASAEREVMLFFGRPHLHFIVQPSNC